MQLVYEEDSDSPLEFTGVKLSEELLEIIEDQVDAGVASTKSEWIRLAAWSFIHLQQFGNEALRETDYRSDHIGATNIQFNIVNTRRPRSQRNQQ